MLCGSRLSRTIRRHATASVLALAAVAASGPAALAQNPISTMHANNANGDVNGKGTVGYTITGTVTVPDSIYSKSGSTEIYIQDATGGVEIFHATNGMSLYRFSLGDSVTLTGKIDQFNGMSELSTLTSYVKHASGKPVPEPMVLTCDSITVGTMRPNYTEPNEGRLVRVNNVHIVSGTWPSTVSGSNVSVYVTDASSVNQLQIFIDKDSPVNGTPAPGDTFSIVGILKQFDNLIPYNFGYELEPRFAWDVYRRGPAITNGPTLSQLDSISATIDWTTDKNATGRIDFGTTSAYGSVVSNLALTTAHSLQLTGLVPNQIYHYKVTTTDSLGIATITGDATLVTPSNRPGIINVYFNKSIDPTYAQNGVVAYGNSDLGALMINRINSATYSLDISLYSFSYANVTNAIISAWNRGVKVRFIMDAGNSQTEMGRLTAAGIPAINSVYGGNHSSGIMHNKTIVVDGRDASNTNDWVWTGSTNCTSTGLYTDAQNAIEIQDYALAQAFTLEFDEMWGSSTDTPNSTLSKMGNRKSDNTPHSFVVNGIPIEMYMSPSDGTESKIVAGINSLQKSALFCILTYTQDGYTGAFQAKPYASTFSLHGVFDSGVDQYSEWNDMTGIGGNQPFSPPADVKLDALPSGLLHHKYLIGDVDNQATALVITGSHNWSNAANTVNDENTLIIHDARIAALYEQEFAMRYHEAGGVQTLPLPVTAIGGGEGASGVAATLALTVVSPTPARDGVTLAYRVPGPQAAPALSVFDTSGRLVRTLRASTSQAPGAYQIRWDGRAANGAAVVSGVYLVRLTDHGTSTTRRIVLAQ